MHTDFQGKKKTPNPQLARMLKILVESREGRTKLYRNFEDMDNAKING